MKNNSHLGETFEHRLERFQNNSPVEAIETLLNSIDNHFNNELRTIVDGDTYQTSLLFMGVHAAALTIAQAFYGMKGGRAYTTYLKDYVDNDLEGGDFSEVSTSLHAWRNVIAHQWISSKGHKLGYDYSMKIGYRQQEDVLYLNPKIYAENYLAAFRAGGRIWNYDQHFDNEQLEAIKTRIIEKYVK